MKIVYLTTQSLLRRIHVLTAADCSISVWKTDGTFEQAYGGHRGGVSDVAWSTDGALLCSTSDDTTIRIWDTTTGKCRRELCGHKSFVVCGKFNSHSNLIASGSFDECFRLWDVRTGSCLKVVQAHSEPVTSIDFSYDGTMILTSSYDGLCRLWDTATGQCLKTLVGEDSPPVSFAKFSPNAKFALVSTLNSNLRLWNCHTAKYSRVFSGHKNTKYSCATAFDKVCGRWIASGSEDGFVHAWDLQNQSTLEKLPCSDEHRDGTVVALCTSESSPLLAAAAMTDRAEALPVRIWGYQ